MSIKSIVKYIGKRNIADDLDKDKLGRIAEEVIERANQDLLSMKEWSECVKEGWVLNKPEFKPKDTPWPNAANFKSTILAEAANNFGNRFAIEIMRLKKLVDSEIIGIDTIKNVIDKKSDQVARWKAELEDAMAQAQSIDPNSPDGAGMAEQAKAIIGEQQKKIADAADKIRQKKEDIRNKTERAERVSELMNWQINHKMEEWRADQKRLGYSLPNVGCLFKKSYYDETLGRCVSEVINFPDFIVNQKTKSLKSCRSFTHIIPFKKSEVELRVKQKLWIDPEVYSTDDKGDAGSDEAAGASSTNDNSDRFYEQYCWLDLDEDGAEEPYIVTVHVGSCKVVRIVARYDEDCIIVKSDKNKPMPLLKAQRKIAQMIKSDNEEFGTNDPLPDPEDLSKFQIVRVEPISILTKYGFIPSPDNTFLDVGFYYLIGAITMGVNKTTNDLLNSGTLANTQSGMVSKGFRRKAGDFKLKPGEFIQTEMSPELMGSAILPLPFKEPSGTLYQLNEKMEGSARAFSNSADLASQIQPNTAPTTALAMIQENLIPNTAHISMMCDSMGHEFMALFDLNRNYQDADDYKKIVGDDEASFSDDFDTEGLHVVCAANPEMSSRMQRMMLATAEMEQIPMVIQAGGNPIPIIKNYYKRLGSENLDEIFPNEAEMSPDEKAQMEQMRQQQEYANQLSEQQVKLMELQTKLLEAGERRKDFEAQVNANKTMSETDVNLEKVDNLKSQTILNLEKAETEQVTNQLNTYTAHSDITAKTEELRLKSEQME